MTPALPTAAVLAWWGTSWLRGRCSPDGLLDAVPEGAGVLGTLAGWRDRGCRGLALALPRPGDPLGLGGPPGFNAEAYDAGEAVLALGVGRGLVPDPDRPGGWSTGPADRGPVPDLGEADRGLRTGLVTAATRLAELDVAAWRPEVADALLDLRHRPHLDHPDGVPARCVDLAARSLQALGIVDLALDDDGAAVSASEIAQRRAALAALEPAARRGLVAACSPDAWPGG